jgi:serine protease Do
MKEVVRYSENSENENSPALDNGIQNNLGIMVEDLTPKQPWRRKSSCEVHGVLIAEIEKQSRAMEAGLLKGDIIEQVNRRPVHSKSEFQRAVAEYQDDPVLLRIRRNEEVKFPVIVTSDSE